MNSFYISFNAKHIDILFLFPTFSNKILHIPLHYNIAYCFLTLLNDIQHLKVINFHQYWTSPLPYTTLPIPSPTSSFIKLLHNDIKYIDSKL